jgi:hypothetical protein
LRYLSIDIAAIQPSEQATIACLKGVFRISPIAQIPGIDVIILSSTSTPPSARSGIVPCKKSVIGRVPVEYKNTPETSKE